MVCPKCGSDILPNSACCVDCGFILNEEIVKAAAAEREKNNKREISDFSDLIKLSFFSMLWPGLAHAIYLSEYSLALIYAVSFGTLIAAVNAYIGTYYIDMPLLVAAFFIYCAAPMHAHLIYMRRFNVADSRDTRQTTTFFRLATFIIAALLYIFIFVYYEQNYNYIITVTGDYFAPLIKNGDHVLVKIAGNNEEYRRGDIVCYDAGFASGTGMMMRMNFDAVERIVGLPGERVKVTGRDIYAAGEKLDEKYLPLDKHVFNAMFSRPSAGTTGPVETLTEEHTLNKEQYLVVLSGNAGAARYSRFVKIYKKYIKGRAVKIVYPFDRRRNLN